MTGAQMNTRPSWHLIWLQTAKNVATRSLCSRAQIGCVIVTSDNRVMCATYNGPAPAFDHGDRPCIEWCQRMQDGDTDSNYHTCPAGHAEANAIARAEWSELRGATLYVNGSVCMGCAKLITQTGISAVYHVVHEGQEYRQPEVVEGYLEEMGVAVFRVSSERVPRSEGG